MRKMRKKKRCKKSHESKVFSVKILRVLPPVILIIGIMIPEYTANKSCQLQPDYSQMAVILLELQSMAVQVNDSDDYSQN